MNDYIAAYHFYTFYTTVVPGVEKVEPLPTLIANVTFQSINGRSCEWAANPISGSNISHITELTFDNVDLGYIKNKQDPWLCTLVNKTTVIGKVYPPLPASCGV